MSGRWLWASILLLNLILVAVLLWNVPASWLVRSLGHQFEPAILEFSKETGVICKIVGPSWGAWLTQEPQPPLEVFCEDPQLEWKGSVEEAREGKFATTLAQKLEPSLSDKFSNHAGAVIFSFLPAQFTSAPLTCYFPGQTDKSGWYICRGPCDQSPVCDRLNH